MTYLKKKFTEAGELLLKVRENQFAFFIAPNVEEAQEFIEYFYTGLLQSKKWHISDNNKWKVIEFHFKEDIFSETIEKVLEKNNYTDRRVSLDFEATIIRNLKEQKTSLNKLYRAFQYAFQYNYLFCLFIDESDENIFLEKLNAIRQIFEIAVMRKAEPLYCIISLSNVQLEILKKNHEQFPGNYLETRLFYLPVLNKQEIESALNEFSIFRDSKEEIRADLIEDIESSDNVLLQLKNAVRKLSVGILPKREVVHKPMQIKKESALKISIKPSESLETSPVKSETIVEKKNEAVTKLDALYNGLGTRFQRNNFKKIMLAAFHISDENILSHHDLNAWELASVLQINDKDILNALNPFIANKYIYFDAETQGEINFIDTNAFYQWPLLIELSRLNKSISTLFEKIGELISITTINEISKQLSNDDWAILKSEDLDFFIDYYSGRIHGLQENIRRIKQSERPQASDVEKEDDEKKEEEVQVNKEVVKIKFGAEKAKLSFSSKMQEDPELLPQISPNESADLKADNGSIVHAIIPEEIVLDEEIEIFEEQIALIADSEATPHADPVEIIEDFIKPVEFHSEELESRDELETPQPFEEIIEVEGNDVLDIEIEDSIEEEPEIIIEKEIVEESNPQEDIEENIPQLKIHPIKIGTQADEIPEEESIDDQAAEDAPRPTSFKIKPMTIRPVENDEPVVRNKLTFKKKE